MNAVEEEIWLKVLAAVAVLAAAIAAAIIGLYSQIKIKQYEAELQSRKEQSDQRRKFYLPLLRFTYELDRRLGHILTKLDKDWLRREHLEKIKAGGGFASNQKEKGYFVISSIYMFACFFGWAEAMKKTVDSTRKAASAGKLQKIGQRIKKSWKEWLGVDEHGNVFFFDPEVSTISKVFQREELFEKYLHAKALVAPRDACSFHKQLQYSIGELMLVEDGANGWRCKSFREFFEAYASNEKFRYWFQKIEELLVDLSDFQEGKSIETQAVLKGDVRALRLLAVRYWCRVLMKRVSEELAVETPPATEVLEGLSPELVDAITGIEVEKLESYLLGYQGRN